MENNTQKILDTVTPLGFKITNKTDKPQVVKLFDVNTKYNNDANIKIDVLLPHGENKTYDELIAETHHENKVFGLISINSENTEQVVKLLALSGAEDEPYHHIYTQLHFTADQANHKFVNIVREITKTERFKLVFEILPNTEMAIRFYDAIEEKPIEINIDISEKHQEVEGSYSNKSYESINRKYSSPITAESGRLSPSPYQIFIKNKTKETLLANLFGFNTNYDKRDCNFGSDEGLEITPTQSNVSYSMLLAQSALQPFETSLIRIVAKTEEQVKQIITFVSTDSNGQSVNVPLITESYWSEKQSQKTIIDIPYCILQDGGTEWFLPILPEEEVSITIFPSEKINISGFLGSDYFEKINRKILVLEELNKELGSRLHKLENKKSLWQKWFSKSK